MSARRSPARIASLILPQLEVILAARLTLLGILDCDDFHRAAIQCKAFSSDYREAMRLQQILSRADDKEPKTAN